MGFVRGVSGGVQCVVGYSVKWDLLEGWVVGYSVKWDLLEGWVVGYRVKWDLLEGWVVGYRVKWDLLEGWVVGYSVKWDLLEGWVVGYRVKWDLLEGCGVSVFILSCVTGQLCAPVCVGVAWLSLFCVMCDRSVVCTSLCWCGRELWAVTRWLWNKDSSWNHSPSQWVWISLDNMIDNAKTCPLWAKEAV